MRAATDPPTISRRKPRIGRYEVVGHLAAGGMAEILLGRVPGESGFARAVVIKRVLPHLARLPEFDTMFLDEARIMSGIHHPNVVQVFDLGREDNELFLVMEYLEGESAAGLMRRLALLREELDPYLAAHTLAEVCAGLHAAHELSDPHGNPQNLVHRDVNPQNVFITYDGSVKLLDFGVAKAADRMSRTEAGQVKGKFSYMSPEQCNGKSLDRRSDVFALGIVFYELATGHRLFARASEMLTFRAICKDRIVPPSEVRTGFPASLEKICLKALERDRSRRYQTAADMRRDLLTALRSAPASEPPDELRAALMQRVFSDRIEEKTELIRHLRSGSDITTIPEAETDLGAELPSVTMGVESSGEQTIEETLSAASAPARARRSWSFPAALALIAALSVGGWIAFKTITPKTPPSSAELAEAPTPTAPRESPPPHADPDAIVLSIDTDPTGASVKLAGTPRGTTPLELRLPKSSTALALELERDGHAVLAEEVVPDRDQKLRLTLKPVARPRGPSEPRAGAPPAPPATSGVKAPKRYYQF